MTSLATYWLRSWNVLGKYVHFMNVVVGVVVVVLLLPLLLPPPLLLLLLLLLLPLSLAFTCGVVTCPPV